MKTFNRDVDLAGGSRLMKGSTVLVDADGNIVANIQDSLASGKIYVGNSSGVTAEVTMSGDATLSNTGALTLAANTVSLAKFARSDSSGKILIGQGSGADAQYAALSGDVTMDGSGAVTIAAGAVENSMVADTAGTGTLAVAKEAIVVYDFDVDGGAQGAIALTGSPTIPDNAIVWCDSYEVLTTLTSFSDAATLTLGFPTDGDLFAAIAISDGANPWDAGIAVQGMDALTVTSQTPKKTAAARTFQVTVAGGQDVTAGKVVFHCRYWVSQ